MRCQQPFICTALLGALSSWSPAGRQHFPADVARQLEEPLYFVDFLRLPVTDPETGEVLDAHPSFYESVAGDLPDIRRRPQQYTIEWMLLNHLASKNHACVCCSASEQKPFAQEAGGGAAAALQRRIARRQA